MARGLRRVNAWNRLKSYCHHDPYNKRKIHLLIYQTYFIWEGFGRFLLFYQFSDKRRQPLHSREELGDNTIVSNVNDDPSPVSLSPTAVTQERDIKQVHVKLRLIERVNILQDDTEGERSTVSA